MLFRSFEKIKEEDYNGFPVRGIVVDNDDPKQLGRVKCEVPGRWPINEYDKIPWIFPFNPYGLGGKITCSSFSVPEVGSELIIVFPYKMEYSPFYIGYYQSLTTHQTLLYGENYPNTYGFSDSQMFWVRVNKEEEYLELFHYSGFTARMYDDGNVHINIPKTLTINIGEDLLINVDGKEVMEVQGTSSKIVFDDKVLNVKGSNSIICESNEYKSVWGIYSRDITGISVLDVTGLQYNNTSSSFTTTVGSNYNLEVSGNVEQDITGYNYLDIGGNYVIEIKDNYEVTVNSNYDLAIVDDYNLLVSGDYNQKIETDKSVYVYEYYKSVIAKDKTTFVIQSDILEAANSYTKAASIVEDGIIYMNSGITVPPTLPINSVEEPSSPTPSIVSFSSIDPNDPIGHGTLLLERAILLLKVESLQFIDEVMKELEDLAFIIRTQLTSLGPGEYVATESQQTTVSVSVFSSDLANTISILNDIGSTGISYIQTNLESIDSTVLTEFSVDEINNLKNNLITNLNILNSKSINTSTKFLVEILDLLDSTYYENLDLDKFSNVISNYFISLFNSSLASKIIKTNVDNIIKESKINVKNNINLTYNFLVENSINSIDTSLLPESTLAVVKPSIIDKLKTNLLTTIKSDLLTLDNEVIDNLLINILTIAGDAETIIATIQNPIDPVSNIKSKLESFEGNSVLLKNISNLVKGYNNARS